jgi:hypothetical protein
MILKTKKDDRVKYCEIIGRVEFVNFKTKTIECIFSIDEKEVCILFDLQGYLIPSGRTMNIPQLEILK